MNKKALKCGIKVNPATLIIVYELMDKKKQRNIELKNFGEHTPLKKLVSDLRKKHDDVLCSISNSQILSLLEKLKLLKKAKKHTETKLEDEDLNRVSEGRLVERKNEMQISFDQHSIPKSHKDFVYDYRVDFDFKDKEENEWDFDGGGQSVKPRYESSFGVSYEDLDNDNDLEEF